MKQCINCLHRSSCKEKGIGHVFVDECLSKDNPGLFYYFHWEPKDPPIEFLSVEEVTL